MQMAVIEYGRHVLGISAAHSTEMDPDNNGAVINMMEEQKAISIKGGTMRLGTYPCLLKESSLAHRIYGSTEVTERHRHRYEFNNEFLEQYEQAGMHASGTNPETGLVEIIEIPDHPFFIGCQYHPELKSTVENPHPLFVHFIAAAKKFNEQRTGSKNPLLQSELI
jgi:CTP synthase